MKTGNRPSVKRISEITGFSPATVSNALNMKRGVNKDTAERIFQVAEELGYFTGSKNLKSIKFVQFRRNGGIIDDSPFHPAVIEGVEEAARENGLSTIYIRLNYSAPDYAEQVSQIISDSNGGVILLATEMLEEDFDLYLNCKCPLILLDGWCERQPFNGVLINNIDSAQNAVHYLIRRGHRDIGYVRGSFRIKAFQARECGYRQALAEHGIKLNPDWCVTVGTKTDSAYVDMLRYLDTNPTLPTAIFRGQRPHRLRRHARAQGGGAAASRRTSPSSASTTCPTARCPAGAHDDTCEQAHDGLGVRAQAPDHDGRPQHGRLQNRKLHRVYRTRERHRLPEVI